MGRRCAQLAGYSLADRASGAIHRFHRPYRKVVGWNTRADAEVILVAQSAFGVVVVGWYPVGPYPVGHGHGIAGARLARDESFGANPEFCQGLQIAPVSA